MSTPNCNDFVTRAEYNQLLTRLEDIEFSISNVQLQLNGHISLDIPQAHRYVPEFTVDTQLNERDLTTSVTIEDTTRDSTITLPDSVVPTVAVEVIPVDNYNHTIVVTVNDSVGEATLTTYKPQIDFAIKETGENKYGFDILLDEELATAELDLTDLAASETGLLDLDFDVDVSYLFNLLTVAVTVNGIKKRDTVYIDADIINRFGGGGSRTNLGEDDMGCQDVADALALELGQILAAIAAVQAQVTQVKDVVTLEVAGTALTKFDCPKTDLDNEEEVDVYNSENYRLPTLSALHRQLSWMNQNQAAMFERICKNGGAFAFPDWWQVRLGSNVPQLVFGFRKADSSTYHSLCVPHPANTNKPTKSLFPPYIKGNWQGMVVCRDNSKFIVNAVSQNEATAMCNVAISLIDPQYLEQPPRVYIGERKGQAVSVDDMIPATIQYFESGQKNMIPNWRVRVAELE